MENTEYEIIGRMVSEIIENGFRLEVFQRWRCAEPRCITYAEIQSNALRASPELNWRSLTGQTVLEAVTKARNVSKYIIDNSKPVR